MPEGLRILHLSDIHFDAPLCLDPEIDLDKPLRTAIINDTKSICNTLGDIDAIVVSGDISSKADPEEFEVAAKWLDEIAEAVGCLPENVFTVPGNHDVDWNVLRTDKVLDPLREKFKRTKVPDRAKEFNDIWMHKEAGPLLMRPLAAYNKFAVRYDCAIYAPDRPFWISDLKLNQDVTLRMRGLTTTLFSGERDSKENLYLGPMQTAFDNCDNVINMAIQHHPPDWLSDGDYVDDALWNRTKIHLMGHKHSQRILSTDHAVRLAAGAVNPKRTEPGWEPGYNIIEIKIVDNDSEQRCLEIKSHLRIWQSSPDQYVPKLTLDGSDFFIKKYSIGAAKQEQALVKEKKTSGQESKTIPEEDKRMPPEATKNLVFRFWNLASSKRREITNQLKLLTQEDLALPEIERYTKAFEKVKELGLVEKLASAIEQAEEHK